MRLVYDPVREHFLKSIIAAEPYVEDLIAAVPGAASEVFQTVAGFRLAAQQTTFGWGVSYTKWLGQFMQDFDPDEDPRNMPLMVMLTFGMPVSFLPFGFVSMGSYFTPVTAAVAAPLDAWNIYKYFS